MDAGEIMMSVVISPHEPSKWEMLNKVSIHFTGRLRWQPPTSPIEAETCLINGKPAYGGRHPLEFMSDLKTIAFHVNRKG